MNEQLPLKETLSEENGTALLPVKLHMVSNRKRATARIKDAAIEVILPREWPKSFQADVVGRLSRHLQREFTKDFQLLNEAVGQQISFNDKKSFESWIRELNLKTLRVPLKGVRIGYSKYSHIAQMNLKTRIMTVSRYCLSRIPESALIYLVIHELAHLKVPNHSKEFWAEVKRFVPDAKYQRRLITAAHRMRTYEADLAGGL